MEDGVGEARLSLRRWAAAIGFGVLAAAAAPAAARAADPDWKAVERVGDHAMVMGDLVLLDPEVSAVMSGLFAGGLEVTAVQNSRK